MTLALLIQVFCFSVLSGVVVAAVAVVSAVAVNHLLWQRLWQSFC
jgi:hypothetical protein